MVAGLCRDRMGTAEVEGECPCMEGDRRDRGISPVGAPIGFAGRLAGKGDKAPLCCLAGLPFDGREGEIMGILSRGGDLAESATETGAMLGTPVFTPFCALLEGRVAE